MPKVKRLDAPRVTKTSLGSTCAILGIYRLVAHDKAYTCSASKNGWHRERFLEKVGWVICDSLPGEVESQLKEALGV